MVSRIDRLFILLDTGSSESVRLAAAKQLGEVQRIQPNELDYLLNRVKEYSFKPVWETRTAAGHAIRCILEHVQPWPCPETVKFCDNTQDNGNSQDIVGFFKQKAPTEQILTSFDLDKVINQCPSLLSNILPADDMDQSSSSKNTSRGGQGRSKKPSSSMAGRRKPNKEQLQRQRQLINKELGMMDGLNIGVGSNEIISNDDLQADFASDICEKTNIEKDVAQTVIGYTSYYNKLIAEFKTNFCGASESSDKSKSTEYAKIEQTWPLEDIANDYETGLFNSSWEIRHGSAIALREIVKLKGKYAGRRAGLTDDINDKLNQLWLVDIALKSLCVLSLDRFGDFLFDHVVAPVRENAAQLLGCCVASLTKSNANLVFEIILRMLDNQCWEIRHGGILALKYSLGVLGHEHVNELIHNTFDAIYKCLADSSDDVSAEAAASLVPVRGLLLETIPEKVPELIKFLWGHLTDLDELTSSTSNMILLLASLITSNSAHLESHEMSQYAPRLWPLMSHSSTSVRISALKALTALIEVRKISCPLWMSNEFLSLSLRLVFQRAMLENMSEVRPHLELVWTKLTSVYGEEEDSLHQCRLNLLMSTSQYLNHWLCLAMQPSRTPIDRGNPLWLNLKLDGTISELKPDGEIYIGSSTFDADTIECQKREVSSCRCLGTKLLGILYTNLIGGDMETSPHSREFLKYLADMFIHYISLKSSVQRVISGWTIESWASHCQKTNGHCKQLELPEPLSNQLKLALQETTLCYDELAPSFTRLQQESRDFVSLLVAANIKTNLPTQSSSSERRVIYNLNQIQYMCDLDIESEMTRTDSKKPLMNTPTAPLPHDIKSRTLFSSLVNKKVSLSKLYHTTMNSQKELSISTLSSIACALISWNSYPEKLNLLTDPLLDSIESDVDIEMQEKSARYLIKLIDHLSLSNNETVIKTIVDRLTHNLFISTVAIALNFDENEAILEAVAELGVKEANQHKIVLLNNIQRQADKSRQSMRRHSSSLISTASSLKRTLSQTSTSEIDTHDTLSPRDSTLKTRPESHEVILRGISFTYNLLVKHFSDSLPYKLPYVWSLMHTTIKMQIQVYTATNRDEKPEMAEGCDKTDNSIKLIKGLTILQVVAFSLSRSLIGESLKFLADLITLLNSTNPLIRYQVCQCIGIMSKIDFKKLEQEILQNVLPMLEADEITSRCGAIEAVACIIEQLSLDDLIPKIDTFIVHVLKRMSDQNDQVRMMATHCFGKLLCLMPLNYEQGDHMKLSCKEQIGNESEFIDQLLNPKNLRNHELPFETSAKLRSYQQEGLNWLAFLNSFNLHGILCDEMGLGKTFMTICMVASDHASNNQAQRNTKHKLLPSLIVCPPTLVEHWLQELHKFVPDETRLILNPVAYGGNASDRFITKQRLSWSLEQGQDLKSKEDSINLIVTSYDILRNDIDFFKSIEWNYCVLDEGHIIKNSKTKLSKSVKLITAKHRLILSGTPIQNNVTELWSLFDFLMPGFLGSERHFYLRYTKPILQSREHKCSSRESEAGALAMESLHRQVLPFILRRLKDDVLDDLPPKIIQDYYCQLSPLQSKLYEDFTRGKLCNNVTKISIDCLTSDDASADLKKSSKSHVFQALQYLKSVCNHPKLVLSPNHSQYNQIKKYLDSEKSTLSDIAHSSKLRALKQLLIDCGIGLSEETQNQTQQQQLQSSTLDLDLAVVNQHRALVFCQLRSMVDIIEDDLFKQHLPSITYLRLDGSIPTNQRQSIVSRFNNDPSIDVLLLTTHIGGLGLNLTGADTVIFVEHDWNPTRDLQAMDRAHRIGQKKVVNVYRLITKDTVEEKIMSLQKFKTKVSSTVINQENTSLNSMNVEQLFDLFEPGPSSSSSSIGGGSSITSNAAKPHTGDLLPELWDQQQYEVEYDLESFVSSINH